MAGKVQKKEKQLVYARDCDKAGELIAELIYKCTVKSNEQLFNWKTGELTKGKIIGCHSQVNCIHYNKK